VEKLRKIGFSKLTPLDDALDKLFSKIQVISIEQIEINDALNPEKYLGQTEEIINRVIKKLER